MKNQLLIIGENSLLKLKLMSILSRSRTVHDAHMVEEIEGFLVSRKVGYLIFCDRLFSDPALNAAKQSGCQVICLASRGAVGDRCEAPHEPGVLQIIYDQLYGFSGYSTSGHTALQLQQSDGGLIHPTLVDDIAFWLSTNLDATGLYYLRGPEGVYQSDFLQALSLEETAYTPHLPEMCNRTVLLRHTLCQGVEIIRHQSTCAVNLIYKMPMSTPLAGTSVGAFRERLGELAAGCLSDALRRSLDYICPLPASGIPYARGVSRVLGLPYLQAVEKTSTARSFHIEDEMVRAELIRSTICVSEAHIQGKRVCLVDEAIFTGVTLKIVCAMLRERGAKEIHVLIPTPPCTAQCGYCSIPTRPMLLETIPRTETAAALGVDSVTFQTKDAFDVLLRETGMTCCACFS